MMFHLLNTLANVSWSFFKTVFILAILVGRESKIIYPLPNFRKYGKILRCVHKTPLLSQLLSVQWLHFLHHFFFFLHLVAKRDTANSIAIRIWKRRTLQTRGVKEDFVELMGFELDFQALGKGEQEGKGSLGGLKWREWSHQSCSGCSGRLASGAMAGEGPECAVTPCG